MKIDYAPPKRKKIEATPRAQQIVYDYLNQKITMSQALAAMGIKKSGSNSLYQNIHKCVCLWVNDGTITFNNDDF